MRNRNRFVILVVVMTAALIVSACGKTPEQQAAEDCLKLGKQDRKHQAFEYFPEMLIPGALETYVEGVHDGKESEVRIQFVPMNIACKSDWKVVVTYNMAGQYCLQKKTLNEVINDMRATIHFKNGHIMELEFDARNNGAITYINNFGDFAEVVDVSVNIRGATTTVVKSLEGVSVVYTVRMRDENFIEALILDTPTYSGTPEPTSTDNAFFRLLNTPTPEPTLTLTPTASFTPAP